MRPPPGLLVFYVDFCENWLFVSARQWFYRFCQIFVRFACVLRGFLHIDALFARVLRVNRWFLYDVLHVLLVFYECFTLGFKESVWIYELLRDVFRKCDEKHVNIKCFQNRCCFCMCFRSFCSFCLGFPCFCVCVACFAGVLRLVLRKVYEFTSFCSIFSEM